MNRQAQKDWMLGEMRLLHKRKLSFKSDGVWVCCPFHANGQERTPSLRLVTDPASSRFGKFVCFACKTYGHFNKLASVLGLRQIPTSGLYEDEIPPIDFKSIKQEYVKNDTNIMPPDAFDWPENENWRNISGKCVVKIGGKMYVDDKVDDVRLFLPAYMNGKLVGGVKCNIIPKDKLNYFNTPGPWSKSNFLFYDTVKQMLQELPAGKKIVVLTEGPRDAANLIQNGVPSLCNLGAINSWSEAKKYFMIGLDADRFILAMDGDEPGLVATKTIYDEIHKYVEVHRLIFPSKNGKKLFDASDLNPLECKALFKFRE